MHPFPRCGHSPFPNAHALISNHACQIFPSNASHKCVQRHSPGVHAEVCRRGCMLQESGRWEARQEGRLCHLWPVCAVRFGPGGRHLAAAGLGGQLCIWDMSSADGSATLELQVTRRYPCVGCTVLEPVLICTPCDILSGILGEPQSNACS